MVQCGVDEHAWIRTESTWTGSGLKLILAGSGLDRNESFFENWQIGLKKSLLFQCDYSKHINNFICIPIRGGTGPGLLESTRAEFCVFLSDPDLESKFVKNRTWIHSHFSISAVAGVSVVISSVKTWVNFGWIND